MSATALLSQVRALGVTVRLNDDNIALRPIAAVPDGLKAQLRAAKPEILAHLRAESAATPPAPLALAPPRYGASNRR